MSHPFPLSLGLLLTCILAAAHGVGAPRQENARVFEFATVAVFKAVKKESRPVISADRRGVFVQTDKGRKRQRYGSKGLTFRPTNARSAVLVEATEIDFELANLAAERRQHTVTSALEEGANQAQDFSDRVNSTPEARQSLLLGPGQTVESITTDSADAWETVDNLQASSARLAKAFQTADSIYFESTLVPSQSLQNVTAAVVLRHHILDHHGKSTGKLSTVLSLEKIGRLKAGQPNKVRFATSFGERFIAGPTVQIYLFDGDMNPLASNLAGPIREVPARHL
jgi:hypothetical protein